MSRIDVATLRLRCPPARRGVARFAIEDALRTELPDDDRLVLVRRVRVGPAGSSTHAGRRQAAMREAWQAAIGDARHGGDDGAGGANCVWFASRDEAERVLLARLLAGRAVDAWFWRLALPGWRGQGAAAWLRDCVRGALAARAERRALALVEACVRLGAVDLLVAALSEEDDRPGVPAATGGLAPSPFSPVPAIAPLEPSDREVVPGLPSSVPLPAALRDVLITVLRDGGGRAVEAVLRALVLRRSPALRLQARMLEATITATREALVRPPAIAPRVSEAPLQGIAPAERIMRAPAPEPHAHGSSRTTTRPLAGPTVDAERALAAERTELGAVSSAPTVAAALSPVPRHSRHAGIWLVVPSLLAMGFREWLGERPLLCGEHPGRQLLLAIARRHRVPPGDPALAVLAPRDDEALPGWTRPWRHALDRWLRRNVRRRLHDLVGRPGMVVNGEERLVVRFPPAAADIRLRRLALDRDPGWVDWLGFSLRYQFCDGADAA